MRIVQAANFVSPISGGLRTCLEALRHGYAEAGHEPVLIVPAARDGEVDTPVGVELRVAAPRVPGAGGYRVITDGARVERLLRRLRPGSLELSDRSTLVGLGPVARGLGARAVGLNHERLDALLARHVPWLAGGRRLAARWARRTAAGLDVVVCTTGWAAAEHVDAGVTNVVRVPLGVDLARFHPAHADVGLRRRLAGEGPLLVLASRLSAEKRPAIAPDALRRLVARGVPATLVVAGDGPLRATLEAEADGLPVVFLGHLADRDRLAALLASADVALAPGPVETFGLAALEAMASGTPVVGSQQGALPEVVGADGGRLAYGHGAAFAAGARALLEAGSPARAGARRRAEGFPWSLTVERMLALHTGDPGRWPAHPLPEPGPRTPAVVRHSVGAGGPAR